MLKQLKRNLFIILIAYSIIPCYAQKAIIRIDLQQEISPMKPIWSWFGYDEPNYTYMKDGKKLLSEIADFSPVPVYMRTHNLLTSGDAMPALKWGSTNAYTEDIDGNPIYDWTIIDSIFDTYIERNMKPLVQVGFMPEALSTNPVPYKHNWKAGDTFQSMITGWAYPPKDYYKWSELVYQWVKHSINRYGKEEVETWYWELWNEPAGYWRGTMEEFLKLYDYTADAVKRALPTAKIGGLNIAPTRKEGAQKWTNAFLKHCIGGTNYVTGAKGTPLDLFLFHAKGEPKFVDGAVQMDMSTQMQDISTGFQNLTAYPEVKDVPIVIGESDPEGCAACGMNTNPENAYRNGTMYSSYTAASFARKHLLADLYGVNLIGAVSWSFEFENQPWFAGFRDLATNGVNKPVLNVFRMFAKMSGHRVLTESNRMYPLEEVVRSSIRGETSDIGALASRDNQSAAVMTWNYHDQDKPGPTETVQLSIQNIPAKKAILSIYMIDRTHSNSYEVWKKMGSPHKPTTKQIKTLEQSGMLACIDTKKVHIKDGMLLLPIMLERQAVALVTLDW